MSFGRRSFLRLAAGAATALALPRPADALDYPTRPVKIVIGFAPGGPADIVARLIGQFLSEKLGQPFVLENRPGAGTTIATETVARSPPDGYTLLWTTSADEINTTLYTKLNYDFARDIAPVAGIGSNPFVMEVNPSFPAKTVAEFIAYAKANPGAVNMTSTGTGNLTHVIGELFKIMAGVDLVHVPGRGEMQAQSDLLAGRAQIMFDPIISSIGYIKAGQLRALAVTSATRLAMLPDVPTVAEFVPGYEVNGVLGIGAPKNTPAAVVNYLNTQINAALADPIINARLTDLGFVPTPTSAAAFGEFIVEETEKWAKVIKTANIKPE